MKTAELVAMLGCANNALHRLADKGILRPTKTPATAGAHRWGYAFEWEPAEQAAAIAVVRLMRSHLLEGGGKGGTTASEARDDCLRSVAEAARAPKPEGGRARWLILLADGSCTRGDDWLAGAMTEHRTLIPLDQ